MATATQPPVQLPFTLHAADEQSNLALACTHRKKEGTIYVTTCRLVFAWTHKTKSKTKYISIHNNRLTEYLFNKDDANDTRVKIVTPENSYVFDIKDKAALKQMRAGRSASSSVNFAASILHLQTQRLFPELDAAKAPRPAAEPAEPVEPAEPAAEPPAAPVAELAHDVANLAAAAMQLASGDRAEARPFSV